MGEKEMERKCGRRNRGRRWWLFATSIVFSNWKGKLVLFCSGAHRVLRNRKPRDLPILTDSWCPPIAVPPFLLATYNGSHPDPGHLETNPTLHIVCIKTLLLHHKSTNNYKL